MTEIPDSRSILGGCNRIVVKIGSALLVDEQKGRVRRNWLAALADDLMALRAEGKDVVIVSSGAIAVGRGQLNFAAPLRLDELQAAAAAGMIRLIHAYEDVLTPHNVTLAQVLLTLDDSESRRRYLNARNTLNTLLAAGAVPLINENDTVATDEIRFGDNDRLAARVAAMISADALILLSDIDGLYSADPGKDETAEWIPAVHELTDEIDAMAGGSASAYGSGGMITKLAAARIAMGAGCRMVITRGHEANPIRLLADGARCTWFLPKATPRTARKEWIAGGLKPRGALVIDDGAAQALSRGKSLLPAGVTVVEGTFQRGDLLIVRNGSGKELARGLSAYASSDVHLIMGRKTREIEGLLGYRGRDEVIHRDDLVLT
ncbi:MAG: glutamate 5-kinase [Rhodospirillales bacterium]